MQEMYEGIQKWDPKEITQIAEKHLMFLTYFFPFLLNKSYNENVVEIRPICRLDKEDSVYLESFNVFRIDDDTKERYIKFLERINGKPYCLYYSSYCFNNKLEIEGKKKTKINNKNAMATGVLAMDFDGITKSEFEKIKKIFSNLELSTLDVFTGHGVQSLILLKEMCFDTSLLKRWTTLLIRKGIKVDGALIDAARVLRMPFSYNCKAFDRQGKYFTFGEIPIGIFTEVIEKATLRYSVGYVFKKIMELPDVIPALVGENEKIESDNRIMQIEKIETPKEKEIKKLEKQRKEIEIQEINENEVRQAYSGLINVKKLPLSVLKMLNKTPEGLRNKVTLFLIPYFKKMGLTVENITEIMIIWGSRCIPRIDSTQIRREVSRLIKYDAKGFAYDKDLATNFGFLDFKLQRENKVKIQKQITNNLDNVSDGAFRIFMAILVNKNLNKNKKNYTINEIIRLANITERTFYNNISYLTTNGILTKNTKVNKKSKEDYLYYINPFLSDFGGFTLLERATVEMMLIRLNDAEVKLYTIMCSMLYRQEEIWAGQSYFAERTGKKQSTVSKLLKSLEDKKFITKKIEKIGVVEHLTYNLNY